MQHTSDKREFHKYVIENFNILSLNQVFIEIHSAESFINNLKKTSAPGVLSIAINSAVFILETDAEMPFTVSIVMAGRSLQLTCSCCSVKSKLCLHQAQVLSYIHKQTELSLFFDKTSRLEHLRKFAQAYGMQHEPELEDYFDIEYDNGRTITKPKLKGLLPLTKENALKLQQEFSIELKRGLESTQCTAGNTQMIVIFRRHRYYKYLTIQLAEIAITESGKIKNPVREINASSFLFDRDSADELKFFSAIQLFENPGESQPSQVHLEGLMMIFRNPMKLNFYEQQEKISEKPTSRSLNPIKLALIVNDLRISVLKENQFYKITGQMEVDGVFCLLEELKIKFDYFIEYQEKLYLPNHIRLLKLFNFFRQNGYCLIIHESRYEEFRQSFLSGLEDKIAINYSYLQAATSLQLQENDFNHPPEKIIYLTESDPYIDIEPVMRYGREEIAVLSKRQIYSKGIRGDVFSVPRDKEAEIAFAALISRQHSFFEEQLQEGLPYFYLHKQRFLDEDWFLNAFEEWQKQGIQILGFNKIRNNRLNANKAKVSVQLLSGLNWFNVNIEVKYGKKKATLKNIRKAVKNKSKYVELDDGTLGILPASWIEKFRSYFEAGEIADDSFRIPKINFGMIRQLFDEEILSNDVQSELDFFQSSLSDFESIKEVKVPAELHEELRDYQKQGLSWLNFLDDYNFGACLADDMGLGKTLQILAFILLQRHKRDFNTNLLVVPTSLIFNWQAEVEKFAPTLSTYILHGNNRNYDFKEFGKHELIITTYGTLLSDMQTLKNFKFNYAILDESQNIKNPESQRYKAARLIKARNRIILTGTPIENNTFDLYAQLSFACPGLLGSKQYFREVYSTPIDKFKDRKRATELQNLIKPFILRRTKKQVAAELPDKTEMLLYCEMHESQRKVYDEYESVMREYLEGISNDDVSKSSVHILRGLTQLRQICDSPLLLKEPTTNNISSSKTDVLMEQIEGKSLNHKILVFSQFVTMLELIRKELDQRNIRHVFLSGNTKNRQGVVEQFQEDPELRVFLISLKAGGTGLNLTKADYVYLIDPWWNPAVENQAIDRVYRIGQKKNVVAVRMICRDTIEEKILKLQENKKELSNSLISTEASFFSSLTKTDLLSLLSPTRPLSLR